MIIADVSEHQAVDWSTYAGTGNRAAIIRAYNGFPADYKFGANRSGFWVAGGRCLEIYAYVSRSRYAEDQAEAFCDTLGPLNPGEFPIGDFREGDGDQEGRASTWRQVVRLRLGIEPWIYSGQYFFREHGLGNAGFSSSRTWIAAYGPNRPARPEHSMWQFSESFGQMAGINARHDSSRRYGTVDDLLTVVSEDEAKHRESGFVPFPGPNKFRLGQVNEYVSMLGTWLIPDTETWRRLQL
ncbi:GH25 family lysozyme [Kitasatospora sp. NPDC088391]|uniref:GH25 family lysozyme n=1 Tax=Kitasatospora sp. NPDC088391 TaxID=3364074 RepID=UPI00381A8C6C